MNPDSEGSPENKVLVGIMGATGSGKTSLINLASGSDLLVGEGLTSCTAHVDIASDFELDGRHVTLIDTPGFDDTNRSDTDILNTIAAHLETSYRAGIKLSGLIYVHRISDFRMGGMSVRNFSMFRKLCGDETLKNVIIVTNMWGEVGLKKGEAREAELRNKFFKSALDKGAKLLRHDNTEESAHSIIRHILQNHPLPLKIQTELVDENKTIEETAAAAELEGQIKELIKKHQAEIKQLQAEFQDALKRKDVEARRELDEARRELQGKIDGMRDDINNLETKYEGEKVRVNEYWEGLLESVQKEKEEQRIAQEEAMKNSMVSQQQDVLSGLMAQMQLDRDNAERRFETVLKDRNTAEEKRMAAEVEARLTKQQLDFEVNLGNLRNERDNARRDHDHLQGRVNKLESDQESSCTVQ